MSYTAMKVWEAEEIVRKFLKDKDIQATESKEQDRIYLDTLPTNITNQMRNTQMRWVATEGDMYIHISVGALKDVNGELSPRIQMWQSGIKGGQIIFSRHEFEDDQVLNEETLTLWLSQTYMELSLEGLSTIRGQSTPLSSLGADFDGDVLNVFQLPPKYVRNIKRGKPEMVFLFFC